MDRRDFLAAATATAALSTVSAAAADPAANPLLAAWTGPRNGAPAFDKVRVADFEAAFSDAIAANRKEIEAICANPAEPDFANTLAALEDCGRPLNRVGSLYSVWASTLADKAMKAVEQRLAPTLAAYDDEVIQNARLFARIQSVHQRAAALKLSPEQARLTEVTYRRFARTGAALGKADKAQLAAINQDLAGLYTTFSQNELNDEEAYAVTVEAAADLSGLPESAIKAAAEEARLRGQAGKWVFPNTRSAMEPLLTYANKRSLREQAFRMWTSRGDNGGEHDNNAVIVRILALRARKARLLGFATFAHWITDDQMAKTPQAAMDLMMQVWKPAREKALSEAADLQALADSEKAGIQIAPWDWRYYSEKVRRAKYDLDESEIRAYLQLEKLREGMFWAAGRLYGFEFVPVSDLPVAHPDIRVFEVRRGGQQIGLWYFDPYARPGKRSGAWMSEYRAQERFAGSVTPIVSNNANFVKPAPGEPVLVSWDDAVTMFHEFGHALHGLNSNVAYPSLAGTAVARDFVEFPSQLNERWLPTHEVLSRFALHWKTGEPMPDALAAKIRRAHGFNQGFATVEYLASAILDMKIHLAGDAEIDPRAFEKTALAEIGMPPQIVMRHRLPHFGHIFSGEGYSAGYYDYIWADTLTADAAEAFTEAGGFYDKAVAKRLHDSIMSVGNTIDAAEAFRRFRGREPRIDALMRDRGFVTAKA